MQYIYIYISFQNEMWSSIYVLSLVLLLQICSIQNILKLYRSALDSFLGPSTASSSFSQLFRCVPNPLREAPRVPSATGKDGAHTGACIGRISRQISRTINQLASLQAAWDHQGDGKPGLSRAPQILGEKIHIASNPQVIHQNTWKRWKLEHMEKKLFNYINIVHKMLVKVFYLLTEPKIVVPREAQIWWCDLTSIELNLPGANPGQSM